MAFPSTNLTELRTDEDVEKYVDALVEATNVGAEALSITETEKSLLCGLIVFLRDYFPPEDFSLDGLRTLLDMANRKGLDISPLDIMVGELKTGEGYKKVITLEKVPSTFERRDGTRPADTGGFNTEEDSTLRYFRTFESQSHNVQDDVVASCVSRLSRLQVEQSKQS